MTSRNGKGAAFGPPSSRRTTAGSYGVASDPAVIEWVIACRRQRMTREQIVKASRTGDDYPGSKPLSNGVLGIIDAILHDRKTTGRTGPAEHRPSKRKPTWGGKERRRLYEENRADGASLLRELELKVVENVMGLEHYVLPVDVNLTEETQDDIARLFQYLGILGHWNDTAMAATLALMGDLTRQRTIEKLRRVAQDERAPAGEREGAKLAIERLEAAQRAKQLSR